MTARREGAGSPNNVGAVVHGGAKTLVMSLPGTVATPLDRGADDARRAWRDTVATAP